RLKREHRKRIQTKTLQVLISLRIDRSWILVDEQIEAGAIHDEGLLQLGEQYVAVNRRLQRCNQQAVVAAGVHAHDRGTGESADTVGFEPFALCGLVESPAYVFFERDHGILQYPHKRTKPPSRCREPAAAGHWHRRPRNRP